MEEGEEGGMDGSGWAARFSLFLPSLHFARRSSFPSHATGSPPPTNRKAAGKRFADLQKNIMLIFFYVRPASRGREQMLTNAILKHSFSNWT